MFSLRFGSVKVVISDQGREFVNRLNKHLFKLTNTQHRISTAYHPQTNGLVERFNQTLQRALLKLVQKEQNDWDEYLDGVLFAYRTSKQKSSQATPFEIMYCRFAIKSNALYRLLFILLCILHRKVVLPLELEYLPDNDSDTSLGEGDVEDYVLKLTDLKKEIYKRAHDNIKKSQWCQKRDYDYKLRRLGVC